MTLVKICGVSDPKHARLAAAFGADFIGMVFAPSKRQVTLGQAKRIAKALGKEPGSRLRAPDTTAIEKALKTRRPLLVGVFADQDPDTVNSIADEVGLDLVQLSGSEPWEVNEHVRCPILKCMKVREGETAKQLMTHYHGGAVMLLDPFVPGTYGGTGRTLDWGVAAGIARRARHDRCCVCRRRPRRCRRIRLHAILRVRPDAEIAAPCWRRPGRTRRVRVVRKPRWVGADAHVRVP
jgi:phosphoribosylanthranilate isomerase